MMRRAGKRVAWVLAVASALGVAGCSDTLRNDPYAQSLAPGEGVLVLPDGAAASLRPQSAETAAMPGRLEERYRFPAGFIEFERAKGGAYYATWADGVEGPSYRALFHGVSVGMTAVPAHLLEPRRAGSVVHAPVTVGGQPCLSFRRAMGPKVAMGRAALAVGVLCRQADDKTPEGEFLDHALAFAKGLRLR